MSLSRRDFAKLTAMASAGAIGGKTMFASSQALAKHHGAPPPDRIDPWIEIDAKALAHNLTYTAERAGRPILAVVKCFAYGLDHRILAPLLEPSESIAGFAVITAEEAHQLRDVGITKPILLMDDFTNQGGAELAKRDITLSVFAQDAKARLQQISKLNAAPVKTSLYIDTGFGRLGMRYDKAQDWVADLAGEKSVRLTGIMTELTDDREFDKQQIGRFQNLTAALSARGIRTGPRHAASTDGLLNHPEGKFDMVRPGNLLHGLPPDTQSHQDLPVTVIYRLKAKVLRVVHLAAGESTSYSRSFIASEPTDIAIVKCGRTDGYLYRKGAMGTQVMIDNTLYPVVGNVSASHCYVNLGKGHNVKPGSIATMAGPEKGIRPHDLAKIQGLGTYEGVNLSQSLPRYLVG